MIIFGVVFYRLNMSVFSFWMYTGNHYVPSLIEFLITFTLVSGGVAAFAVISKLLPIFQSDEAHA